MYNTDLDRPPAEILEDLRGAAMVNAAPGLKTGIIAVPFATLLVKLAQEADQTAQSVRAFTKALLAFTFALFLLTLALFALQAYQIFQDNYLYNQSTERRNSGDQQPYITPSNI